MKNFPNKNWTLFLDRDGVINERIPGSYVRNWEEFEFMHGSLDAVVELSALFNKVLVVTNQQGIGKGIMTAQELELVHNQMLEEVDAKGGKINKVYYCPELGIHNPPCRKPNSGMALQAQKDFPSINFKESIMVGDSASDMEFGIRLGMKTVFIEGKEEDYEESLTLDIDWRFTSLKGFTNFCLLNM